MPIGVAARDLEGLGLLSTAVTRQVEACFATLTAIAPLPVPTSATRAAFSSAAGF